MTNIGQLLTVSTMLLTALFLLVVLVGSVYLLIGGSFKFIKINREIIIRKKNVIKDILIDKGFKAKKLVGNRELLSEFNVDKNTYYYYDVTNTIKVALFFNWKDNKFSMFSYNIDKIEHKENILDYYYTPTIFYVGTYSIDTVFENVTEQVLELYNIKITL